MSNTTDELVSELAAHMGITISDTSQELNTDEALLILNRAYWELLDKFPFREKEVTVTFPTVVGQRNYVVPTPFEALRQLSILNLNSENQGDQLLSILDRDTIFSHEDGRSQDTNDRGFPERYVRDGNYIRLSPVPDDVYTITMKYWTVLSDLNNDPSALQNPATPRNWFEIILYGGCYRAAVRQKAWQDVNNFRSLHNSAINSATPVESKEEIDSHRSGLEVLGRDDCNWR